MAGGEGYGITMVLSELEKVGFSGGEGVSTDERKPVMSLRIDGMGPGRFPTFPTWEGVSGMYSK